MIDQLLALIKTPLPELIKAREALTDRYRTHKDKRMKTLAEKESYLLTRFPATYAVAESVFEKIPFQIDSLLDVGSGPGTASMAAMNNQNISSISCIELDKTLLDWANKLIPSAKCQNADFTKVDFAPHDVVVFSYSIGEIENPIQVIEKGYAAANKALVIIEPGTPHAYQNLMRMRDKLIEKGAYILAPCPHLKRCPLEGNDWCHFSVRVARSWIHKKLKSAELGYEDEKYCYLIVTKEPSKSFPRIIRHVEKHSGHLKMTLCTEEGIENVTFTRSMPNYSKIKKLEWGDSLIPIEDAPEEGTFS